MEEEIAKLLISMEMDKFFAEGGVISQKALESTEKIYEEIDKLDRPNTVAIVTMSVIKTEVDGRKGYTVSGGSCGSVAMLTALSVMIRSQLSEAVASDETTEDGNINLTVQ